MSFNYGCEYPAGMIVKMLLKATVDKVEIDQVPSDYEIKKEFGGNWLYMVVPTGQHRVKVLFNT